MEPIRSPQWLPMRAKNTVTSTTGSGTYTIAASGYGYMSTPLQFVYSQFEGDEIKLLVSPSQVVVGSTTDNNTGYNDLFLAAPCPRPHRRLRCRAHFPLSV